MNIVFFKKQLTFCSLLAPISQYISKFGWLFIVHVIYKSQEYLSFSYLNTDKDT